MGLVGHDSARCAPMWHDSEDRDRGAEPDYCACEAP
jgi:hypothetical protein